MFAIMEEYTFKKAVSDLAVKGISAQIVVNSLNQYFDYFTKKNITSEKYDDETVIIMVYRDLTEG